ncbi:MAG TPA: hypothetical protein VGB88_00800 [Alphaproteobacteria bacterium]
MTICDAIQKRLAEDGTAVADRDAEVRRHIDGCADCRRVLAELGRLDTALAALPVYDAPDALVAATLDAVRRAPGAASAPARPRVLRGYLAGGLAASVVALGLLGVTYSVLGPTWQRSPVVTELADGNSTVEAPAATATGDDVFAVGPQFQRAAPEREAYDRDGPELAELADERREQGAYRTLDDREWDVIAQLDEQAAAGAREQRQAAGQNAEDAGERRQLEESLTSHAMAKAAPAKPDSEPAENRAAARSVDRLGADEGARMRAVPSAPPEAAERKDRADERQEMSAAAGASVRAAVVGGEIGEPADPRRRARDFLAGWRAQDELLVQPARGYWANTYIPGDPEMRLLAARLRDWNRAALGRDTRLEQLVRPVGQPFDAPRDAAMAVYLDADAAAIAGPTRLRVQVGLKGVERQGGHRPAMTIGVVVDLRDAVDPGKGARIRALIAALDRARQPEDSFSLTVAGPAGGLLVPPEQFRHGPLQVAMARMFDPSQRSASSALDLAQALALAEEAVRQGDDPDAVLGSSLVLLVTDSALAGEAAALEPLVHRNAVDGVALSVVGLGGQGDLAPIERLVAAGQGNRRILDSAQAADGLVDRELHAASRSVARALRLRVRLAPGVELIDILGSRPLGEPQAQRVREAEQAIDRRLARNLGIEADRGRDEEGIQIVIPNFYAGDTHVILLDVLADRPGPIADVTLRYKDVVYLRNGVAGASLAIDDGEAAPGPLQANVAKNLVAWEFARDMREVGRMLAAGEVQAAVARIADLRGLIAGLRLEVPGWSGDPDLAADESLLDAYLAVLQSPAAGDAVQRDYLADSLHYAAFRKLQAAAR